MKIKIYQILNITGLIAMIVVNFLANSLPIGGRNTGEISALYPTLFTPAGFTFSIWGVIYLLLMVFCFYQAKGVFSDSDLKRNRFLYRIDVWFFISCLANISWIFAWHNDLIWVSVILMVILLASLMTIYFYLGVGRSIISRAEYFMVHVPFSVYLGWITVATIANIAVFLIKSHWYQFGLSEEFWTVLMISIASLLGIYVLLFRKDFYFSIVIVWALFGIISRRLADEAESMEPIILAAGAGILIILALSLFYRLKKFFKNPEETAINQ